MQKGSSSNEVFDRQLLRRRRDRASGRIHQFDFLLSEVADQIMDRLSVIQKSFPLMLDLGSAHGVLTEKIRQREGTRNVVAMDLSASMIRQSGGMGVVADEEFFPFRHESLDAIVSNLHLHWVNDLPGAFLQIKNALKPDGLFLAALLGGESLTELRQCLMEAELAVTGGASPRVSPFADSQDIGALLQRAGFALPVVDSETLTVYYSHPFKLMHDLRGMGGSNAVLSRLMKPTRRQVLMEAARIYQEKFGNAEAHVPATFHVIHLIGWAPHGRQQQPLKPGSAKHRLAEALKTVEVSAGEKTS